MPTETHHADSNVSAQSGFPHPLTDEDRRKGGLNRAAKIRAKRQQAERVVIEKLAQKAEPLVLKQIELALAAPDSEDVPASVQHAATNSALDRLLGKPSQSIEHSGPDGAPIVVEHRDKLSLRDGLAKVAARRGVTSSSTSEPHG